MTSLPQIPRQFVLTWWRTRSLTPSRSSNQRISTNHLYSTRYRTSNPFNLPDAVRNLILFIFPKQRTDVGSIPIPMMVQFFHTIVAQG